MSFLKLSSSNNSNNDSTVNESAEIIEHIVDKINNIYLFQVNRDSQRKKEKRREQELEPVQEFKH